MTIRNPYLANQIASARLRPPPHPLEATASDIGRWINCLHGLRQDERSGVMEKINARVAAIAAAVAGGAQIRMTIEVESLVRRLLPGAASDGRHESADGDAQRQ
jgi:hypothetical protein